MMKQKTLKRKIKETANQVDLPDAKKIEQTGKGALFLVSAVGLGLGVFWLGNKYFGSVIDDFQEASCRKEIHRIGSACHYADRLYSAIDGPGTSNREVFSVLNAIRTQGEYNQVAKAYDHLTRGDQLNQALRGDLNDDEFQAAVRIISSKPA